MRRWLAIASTVVLVACSPAPVATPPAATPVAAASPGDEPTAAPTQPTLPTPAPSLAPPAADLDGMLVADALAHRLPLAVSIDDSRAARPQSGFNATSIVWHAPADGYEARYLLVFQELDAPDIGPVRSSRMYQADWTAELNGALAHYGGDEKTRTWLKYHGAEYLTDVDGLGRGNPAYHRIRSREAPHNAYTSTADLWRLAGQLGGASTIDPAVHLRPFRADLPVEERGASQTVKVPYNTVTVGYEYDPATNAYARLLNGKPHVDPMDGEEVRARTIVVLFMSFRTSSKIEPGHNRPVLGFIGTGSALVISEGRVVEATWSKAAVGAPTMILDTDGQELPLVRGRIFFQVVPKGTDVRIGD